MKCFKLFVLLAAVVATPFALAEGDPEAGKEKAQVCAACHGPDGNSPSGQYPSLAGQGERYLIKQLKAYKSGERENAIMQGQAAFGTPKVLGRVASCAWLQDTESLAVLAWDRF